MIGLWLVMTAAQAASVPADAMPVRPALSVEQRAAADRLLDATGASARRQPQIDEQIDHMLVFTSPRCAAAAITSQPSRACAAQNPVGRAILAAHLSSDAELLAKIQEIQGRAYAAHLSVADMEAVTQFARTPAGAHFFATARDAASEAARLSDLAVIDRVQAVIDRVEAKLPQSKTVTEPDK